MKKNKPKRKPTVHADGTPRVSIVVSRETLAKLDALAKSQGMKRSTFISAELDALAEKVAQDLATQALALLRKAVRVLQRPTQ